MSLWAKRELLFRLLLEYGWQKWGLWVQLLRIRRDADICRCRQELCDNSSHASRPEKTMAVQQLRVVFKKPRNTSWTSGALIWISQHEEQANKTHRALLLTLTHLYTVCESGKITPEQTVINNTSRQGKKAERVQWSALVSQSTLWIDRITRLSLQLATVRLYFGTAAIWAEC